MKVGILVPFSPLESGGAASYHLTILSSFREQNSTKHEFVFLDGHANVLDDKTLFNCILETASQTPTNQGNSLPNSSKPIVFVIVLHLVKAVLMLGRRVSLKLSRILGLHSTSSLKHPITNRLDDLEIDLVWYLESSPWPHSRPFIITVFDLQHRKQSYFPEVSLTGWTWEEREKYYSSLLPRAAQVIVGTPTGKQEVIDFYSLPPERVLVNPFPVPSQFMADEEVSDLFISKVTSKPFLFYPAQFWPHKNHYNLLEALSLCSSLGDDCPNLVLAGSDKGNEEYIRGRVSELELCGKVFFLGFVSRSSIALLYTRALALIYPTFFGPDNLPPLEAFSYGCPVLASSVAGAVDQLGQAALYFDPSRPDQIAECITKIVRDPSLRSRLAAKGRIQLQGRQPKDYFDRIVSFLDSFESIRRTWGAGYVHS